LTNFPVNQYTTFEQSNAGFPLLPFNILKRQLQRVEVGISRYWKRSDACFFRSLGIGFLITDEEGAFPCYLVPGYGPLDHQGIGLPAQASADVAVMRTIKPVEQMDAFCG